MSQTLFTRSFSGGELAPSLAARADLAQYVAGLRTCRNFLVQRHGGVSNRPGFRFVERIKGAVAFSQLLLSLTPTNYWRLDEFGGTVAYDSGSGLDHGTVVGTPTLGTLVPPTGGYGLTFDGVNDMITVAGVASTTTFWLAFWIVPDSGSNASAIVIAETGNQDIRYNPATRKVSIFQAGDQPMNTALADGVPAFIVLNVVAGAGTWYLNGVADGTAAGILTWTPDHIGARTAATNRLKGTLSEVAMKAGASLTAGQITALYAARVDSQAQLFKYLSEEPNESLLLEAGSGYLRFYRQGALLRLAATPTAWSIATPYVAGDLVSSAGLNYYCILANTGFGPPNGTYWYRLTDDIYEVPTPFTAGVNLAQSGRVLTLTHRDVPPRELIFIALTRWVLQAITIAPGAPTVTGFVSPTGVGGAVKYVVSAAAPGTYEEGLPCAPITSNGTPPSSTFHHAFTWDAMTLGGLPCPQYYLYADVNNSGTFGYIGTTTGQQTFSYDGAPPDFTQTPRVNQALFGSTLNYPHRAAYHQQRRFFGNTRTNPDLLWGSRVGFPSNFTISSPLQDDDALTISIAGNQHNPVRHLMSIKQLILLTAAGEWSVTGGGQLTATLAPSSLDANQQLYTGSDEAAPVIIGDTLVYVQARGVKLCDVRFEQAVEGLAGRELTTLVGHLVDDYTLSELDYQYQPHSIIWLVRSDGTLLALTYLREQNMLAWHHHDTYSAAGQSAFEHVCTVPESDEDALYAIVARVINGNTVRYVERLERRRLLTVNSDAFYVDCGLSYSGSPIATVTGLDHLEGETVVALGDGAVLGPFTVTAGSITLDAACRDIHVGLTVTADLETLDLDIADSQIRDKPKSVKAVALLLDKSARTFRVGPTSAKTVPYRKPPAPQDALLATDLFTGQVELAVKSQFDTYGRVFLRHVDPLPLSVLGILPSVEVGG